MSESFTNDAATGSAVYPYGTLPPPTASAQTLKVTYDAGSQSYTIEVPGRSQTFRPADKVASGDPNVTGYVRTNGNTTDQLALSNPSAATLSYVSTGIWARTVQNGPTTTATAEAFVFGVETPDDRLVRSGSAQYTLALSGTIAGNGHPAGVSDAVGLTGSGTLKIDFGSGQIRIFGASNQLYSNGTLDPIAMRFYGLAQLSSNTNHFEGPFSLSDTFGPLTGALQGRLFGPNAEEVGASFYATRQPGVFDAPSAAVGTLIGKRSGSAASGGLFSRAAVLAYNRSNIIGSIVPPATSSESIPFLFEPGVTSDGFNQWLLSDVGSYNVMVADGLPNQVINESLTLPMTIRQFSNGPERIFSTLMLYNGKPYQGITLSYSGFGNWTASKPPFAASDGVSYPFIFGTLTPAASIPRTGSASYAGFVVGTGLGPSPADDHYELSGPSSLAFNFGAGTYTGSMNPTATAFVPIGTPSPISLGSFGFAGTVTAQKSQFSGDIQFGGQSVGALVGNFFGPAADEVGATFRFQGGTANGLPGASTFVGTLAGRKN